MKLRPDIIEEMLKLIIEGLALVYQLNKKVPQILMINSYYSLYRVLKM